MTRITIVGHDEEIGLPEIIGLVLQERHPMGTIRYESIGKRWYTDPWFQLNFKDEIGKNFGRHIREQIYCGKVVTKMQIMDFQAQKQQQPDTDAARHQAIRWQKMCGMGKTRKMETCNPILRLPQACGAAMQHGLLSRLSLVFFTFFSLKKMVLWLPARTEVKAVC